MKIFICLLNILFGISMLPARISAQQQGKTSDHEIIDLIPRFAPLRTKSYQIVQLTDERVVQRSKETPHSFATLMGTIPETGTWIRKDADLNGGLVPALFQFINGADNHQNPWCQILIRIKKCGITESVSSPGLVSGKMNLSFEFDRLVDADTLVLTTYTSTGGYLRSAGEQEQISPAFSKMLANALNSFASWFEAASAANYKLGRAVRISVVRAESQGDDTLEYRKDQPLIWNDFRERPPATSRFGAQVFPIFSFSEHYTVENGVIRVVVRVRAAVARSSCWVKPESRTSYALNHEQRHFDILAIIAERFIADLKKRNYPLVNFDGEINALYLAAYHELGKEEDLYDRVSDHGQNTSEQERWNLKIDRALSGLSSGPL